MTRRITAIAIATASLSGCAGVQSPQDTQASYDAALKVPVVVYCVDQASRVIHSDLCESPSRGAHRGSVAGEGRSLWLSVSVSSDLQIGSVIDDSGTLIGAADWRAREAIGLPYGTSVPNGATIVVLESIAHDLGLLSDSGSPRATGATESVTR